MQSFCRLLTVTVYLLLFSLPGAAQSTARPPDGIYFSFQQLSAARPGLLPEQLRNAQQKTISPRPWFSRDSLYCISEGKKVNIPHDSLYAFVDDGQLYFQRKLFAHKASVVGTLTFFTENYPVISSPAPVSIDQAKQSIPRILDFTTGRIVDYNVAVMEEILRERDTVLYQEYMHLTPQKLKRQLLLRYIEKFNERHPLYGRKEN